MKGNYACKLSDLKVVLGVDQRKVLHTTTSTICIGMSDEDVVGPETKQVKNDEIKETVLEGIVISIDMSSLMVFHLCTRCSASVGIESVFYSCSSCSMMGTMDSVNTFKPKIAFCFKDLQNNKHNLEVGAALLEDFTVHTILNKLKLEMQNACIFDKIYKQ